MAKEDQQSISDSELCPLLSNNIALESYQNKIGRFLKNNDYWVKV